LFAIGFLCYYLRMKASFATCVLLSVANIVVHFSSTLFSPVREPDLANRLPGCKADQRLLTTRGFKNAISDATQDELPVVTDPTIAKNECEKFGCRYDREVIWDICWPDSSDCVSVFSHQKAFSWKRTVVYYRCRKSQNTWVDRIWCPNNWARQQVCCYIAETGAKPGCEHDGKIECGDG
jgi:hypothetical protein